MAVQIKVQLNCNSQIAFRCANETINNFKNYDFASSDICKSIFCLISKRATGDGFSPVKPFIINFVEQGENLTLMYITGDNESPNIPTNGNVISVMGQFLTKFDENMKRIQGQSTGFNKYTQGDGSIV